MTSRTILSPSPWRLFRVLAGALLAIALATLALDPGVEGMRLLIRITARTSLLLFLVAFTASALVAHWPGPGTRWTLRHRRQFGLAFALSHTIHLAAIVAFAHLDGPAFHGVTSTANLVTGGLGYVFIAAMSATSFDAAVAWMGARAWRRLHLAGATYLWISFAIAFGKRLPMSPYYVAPLLLLVLALALRLWPRAKSRLVAAVAK
jgi:hypothetical protein